MSTAPFRLYSAFATSWAAYGWRSMALIAIGVVATWTDSLNGESAQGDEEKFVPPVYEIQRTATPIKIDGKLDSGRKILADSRWVSTGYFDTMRIPTLVGTTCHQSASTNDVDVVVNRSFANLYMGGTAGIGHTLEEILLELQKR